MKLFTLLLAAISILLSLCVLFPAPNFTLLPLTVAVPEVSPWLIVFNLIAAMVALALYRPTLPVFLASLFLAMGLLAQVRPVLLEMDRQFALGGTGTGSLHQDPAAAYSAGFAGAGRGSKTLGAIFRDSIAGMRLASIPVERLPMNILFYRAVAQSGGAAELHAAVIDIYGGAWQRGSPEDNADFHRALASRGYAVFAIDYRHAPAAQFPAQIEDVRATLSFIAQNASRYGVDPRRLVLCGHSSGGQLALLAAFQPEESGAEAGPEVAGVIGFYAPTDLAGGYADLPSPDPIAVRRVLETYLGGTPDSAGDRYRAASPIAHVRRGLPATLLIQGSRDHIVKPRFARELYPKLIETGNRAYLLELPWSEHAFDAVFSGVGSQVALVYVEKFMEETVGDAPSS